MTATIFEAKTNLSELIKKANAGEEVIITSGREKKHVARLTSVEHVPNRRIGFLKHLNLPPIPDSVFFDPLPEEELRLWEDGGPDDPLNWSRERIEKVNAEANKNATQGK
jgi:prevent-host-death family protein